MRSRVAKKRKRQVLIRQHERWLEELDVQLSFRASITASGAIMTISAATADLKD